MKFTILLSRCIKGTNTIKDQGYKLRLQNVGGQISQKATICKGYIEKRRENQIGCE
jgi:hypothetical protein